MPPLPAPSALKTISLDENTSLTSLPDLSGLASLEYLGLTDCCSLSSWPERSALPSLQPWLSSLRQFTLPLNRCLTAECQWQRLAETISILTALDCLVIQGDDVPELPSLSPLSSLSSLNTLLLKLPRLSTLPSFDALSSLTKLVVLVLHCPSLTAMPDLSKLPALTNLKMPACMSVKAASFKPAKLPPTVDWLAVPQHLEAHVPNQYHAIWDVNVRAFVRRVEEEPIRC